MRVPPACMCGSKVTSFDGFFVTPSASKRRSFAPAGISRSLNVRNTPGPGAVYFGS